MSPPPSRRVTPDPREVPSRATLVPAPADPEDDLDPLARELLRQIRNHNADELKVNAEGFDGLRSEFAGLRKDFSRMADRMEKNQRAAFWLVGAIVVVALVAVVAVSGAQINAQGFGLAVGTADPKAAPISGRKPDPGE